MPALTIRQARQRRLDSWLLKNAERVAADDGNTIARALREAGYFSARTALIDIRMSYRRRCLQLGLPYKVS